MRCEPWMNRTPVPQKTPLQIAQDDLAHWARRQRQLIAELAEVDRQFAEAGARVDSLCRESISAKTS